MYHHVDCFESDNSLHVSPEVFAEQIKFIVSRGYKVLTLDMFIKYINGEEKIKDKNMVLLTFDDGYDDNFTYVYNILRANGIGGLFFIPVKKIGLKGWLDLKQIEIMDYNGMMFGSHTLNEKYLPDLDREQAYKELKESKNELEKILDEEIKSIAYCSGGYTKETLELVKKAGYKTGFTTNRGFEKNSKNDNIYALRRIKVTDRDNNFRMWIKLSGIYDLFRTVKYPY